jgi:hypothetical protein
VCLDPLIFGESSAGTYIFQNELEVCVKDLAKNVRTGSSRRKHRQALRMAARFTEKGMSHSSALRKAWKSVNKGKGATSGRRKIKPKK